MSQVRKGIRQLVAEAEERVSTWSPREAAERHQAGSCTIVDLRDVREVHREGRIPGSFHAPRGMLEFWVDPESPYYKDVFGHDTTYVLYCASGWRSALAAATLLDMGMENVAHIGGGFTAWREAALPTETVERKSKG